jgi:hypothetical protein
MLVFFALSLGTSAPRPSPLRSPIFPSSWDAGLMTGVSTHANFSHGAPCLAAGWRQSASTGVSAPSGLNQESLTMKICMRTLILRAAIGMAPAVTIIPTQAAMIGPGKLQISEPASLAEPVRARVGVSRVSTVRAGGVTPGSARIGSITVDPRALNRKAKQSPRGRYCHHGGCQK